jgi:hypothetical protein
MNPNSMGDGIHHIVKAATVPKENTKCKWTRDDVCEGKEY